MNLLTTSEIAKKLEEWADNLSYDLPSTTKIELTPSWRYKKVILLLLMKTNVGAKVERDFDALDKLHAEYESWRGKAITEDNEEEFRILVDSLKGALYDLSETLQQIAQNAREELSSEKPAETEPDTTPAKEEVEKAKPTTSPAGLLKYLNVVLDDIERLEGSRRFKPYVDKYIRTELATAYHETKKAVEKIRAQNPAIKETPADSNDPREYLRNVHTWCVGQLFWENGERIEETLAETGQSTTPAKREKENWLWKLYEKTLKVIIDAVLERVWPK